MQLTGLVGGTTWLSTIDYYRYINEEISRRLGGLHSARLVIHSIDFAEVVAHANAGDSEAEANVIIQAARSVEQAGAQLLALCANTAHIHAESVAAAVSIPLVNIVEEVAKALSAADTGTVGVLCTGRTRAAGIFDTALSKISNLRLVMPCDHEQEELDRMIVKGASQGKFDNDDLLLLETQIHALRRRGADAILLGCTELQVVLGEHEIPCAFFDSTRIHAMAIVEAALQSKAAI